ncbi:MAG: GMC oxidoreductase, partial [Chloroflexota bacterium]
LGKVVIVCGYSIETPRLLLMSAAPGHENGLANSSGLVGNYLMVQSANVVMGRFPDLIRQYKAPPANACTEAFYDTDPSRDFARGFSIQTVGPLPVAFAKQMMVAKGAWGWGMRQVMMDYNHWAALGLLGEILPHKENRVGLSDLKDEYGLPAPSVWFEMEDNDKKMITWAVPRIEEILRAAGAEEVAQEPRFAHLIGGARMGDDPRESVTDRFGRTHDIPNLFCCDGSICPTQGAANPALTIQALAARTADYIIAQRDFVLDKRPAPLEKPPVRRDLSPPGTFTRGVPRLR